MEWKLKLNIKHEESPNLKSNYGHLLSGGKTNEGLDQTGAGKHVAHVKFPRNQIVTPKTNGRCFKFLTNSATAKMHRKGPFKIRQLQNIGRIT